MADLKTVEELDVSGKKVLLRVEFNVPLKDGKVVDDERIIVALPTINYLLDNNAKLIIMAHLGRPDGKRIEAMSLKPAAEDLSSKIGKPVQLAPDCIGDGVIKIIDSMEPGQVVMLENLRFHSEEESNDEAFAGTLADLADVYVIDGFGVAHRKAASVVGVPLLMLKDGKQVGAGYLMQKEIALWGEVAASTGKKILVIGGFKLKEKMKAIKALAGQFEYVIVGGVPYNVLQHAHGLDVGNSLVAEKGENYTDYGKEILKEHKNLILSEEVIVARKEDGEWKDQKVVAINDGVPDGYAIIDILFSDEAREKLKTVEYVIIFGPLGIFEKGFTEGTGQLREALSENPNIKVIVGGGDSSLAYKGIPKMTLSTGGGAAITYLIKKTLAAAEALKGNVDFFKKA